MKNNAAYLLLVSLCLIMYACHDKTSIKHDNSDQYIYESPLGYKFLKEEPTEDLLKKLEAAKLAYKQDSTLDNFIWWGRRMAYTGDYPSAIQIYSEGLEKFPRNSRLLRHRGHRYISLREFDKAIDDLSLAAELIKGTENSPEEDGLPNARNIPVSSKHGNIYYHLGLAHYLKGDHQKSFDNFLLCRQSGKWDDNIVSSTHWLYMNACRMEESELAVEVLAEVHDSMDIIENHSYYQLCRMYKGLISIDSLELQNGSASNDALAYGLANYHFCNGERGKAELALKSILQGEIWNSFGYISAESDFLAHFSG